MTRPDEAAWRVMVDRSHMGRRASGIERITETQFSPAALAPLRVGAMQASGRRAAMVGTQMLLNPALALTQPAVPWIFPGYPPSPVFGLLRQRTVLYVHDLFLLTRPQDLNMAARLYMAQPFRRAITSLRYFLVNSATTRAHLAPHVTADAEIRLYRPHVSNVFGLQRRPPAERTVANAPLIVGAVGTIEPRKNFGAAAEVCRMLAEAIGRPVELHIIGRAGWGEDAAALAQMPHVHLHGFLPDEKARAVIGRFDLFLCTSHDEGLGLPLLEMQYASLPVIAPDAAVFREVLSGSGLYFDPRAPQDAVTTIAALLQRPDWRAQAAASARANIARWNTQADADRAAVVAFLSDLCARLAGVEDRTPRRQTVRRH